MKILVTGGAGFIGSYITDILIDAGHEVTILDNLDPQVHENGKIPDYLNKKAVFVKGDVLDYDLFKELILKSEAVFHEASAVGVGQSQYEIKHYTDVNVSGTANMLDIIVNNKHKIRKIIVAASMSSYGEGNYMCKKHGVVRPGLRSEEQLKNSDWDLYCPKEGCHNRLTPVPTDEKAERQSNSIYAITKATQEDLVLNIGKTYGIPAIALRYFNVYGPRQSLSNPYTGVAAIFMSRIKSGNPPIIYEDGLQARDFISINDVARANLLALESDAANFLGINIGTGLPVSILEVAKTIANLYGSKAEPEIRRKFRKGDVRNCYADITLAKKVLNWHPLVSFEDGMNELIEASRNIESTDNYSKAEQELKDKGII